MDFLKAEELRKLCGTKPFTNPKFENESHLVWVYVEEKTGDYVCTQCGQDFTKNEYDRVIAERNKNQ